VIYLILMRSVCMHEVQMKIGIPTEVNPGERRVAVSPKGVARLKQLGFEVLIQTSAGTGSSFTDQDYEKSGARIVQGARDVWSEADIVVKLKPPMRHPALGIDEVELLRPGQTFVSFIFPGQSPELLQRLNQTGATAIAMDGIPRISRAQKMDALSSMANIAGYRAITEAARSFGRFFGGQITAAGKIPPAKVLVIGAGVAGLAAIGHARSLGAIVRAFDTRPQVKDEVKSMGAEFLELQFAEDGTGVGGYAKTMSPEFIKAEMELFAKQCREVDIVVTTAQIPGKKAPILITREMVEAMLPGSVIVDLAAEQGGNCELTSPGRFVEYKGVRILGMTDLAGRLPTQASEFYSTNIVNLIEHLGGSSQWKIDLEDEITRGATVCHKSQILWPPPAPKPAPAPVAKPVQPAQTKTEVVEGKAAGGLRKFNGLQWTGIAAAVAFLIFIGFVAPPAFLQHFTIFILSCFLGWQVIWNVTAALHTPLMSVTNAISAIIVVGAITQMQSGSSSRTAVNLAIAACFFAALNIFGGFAVTQRMLRMFRK
jgi:NAD(P) transhydrogenase subunit alpha